MFPKGFPDADYTREITRERTYMTSFESSAGMNSQLVSKKDIRDVDVIFKKEAAFSSRRANRRYLQFIAKNSLIYNNLPSGQKRNFARNMYNYLCNVEDRNFYCLVEEEQKFVLMSGCASTDDTSAKGKKDAVTAIETTCKEDWVKNFNLLQPLWLIGEFPDENGSDAWCDCDAPASNSNTPPTEKVTMTSSSSFGRLPATMPFVLTKDEGKTWQRPSNKAELRQFLVDNGLSNVLIVPPDSRTASTVRENETKGPAFAAAPALSDQRGVVDDPITKANRSVASTGTPCMPTFACQDWLRNGNSTIVSGYDSLVTIEDASHLSLLDGASWSGVHGDFSAGEHRDVSHETRSAGGLAKEEAKVEVDALSSDSMSSWLTKCQGDDEEPEDGDSWSLVASTHLKDGDGDSKDGMLVQVHTSKAIGIALAPTATNETVDKPAVQEAELLFQRAHIPRRQKPTNGDSDLRAIKEARADLIDAGLNELLASASKANNLKGKMENEVEERHTKGNQSTGQTQTKCCATKNGQETMPCTSTFSEPSSKPMAGTAQKIHRRSMSDTNLVQNESGPNSSSSSSNCYSAMTRHRPTEGNNKTTTESISPLPVPPLDKDLTENEKLVVAKYKKLQRIGIPDAALRHKMKRERVGYKIAASVFGTDHAIDLDSKRASVDSKPVGVDTRLELAFWKPLSGEDARIAAKYLKMKKICIPPDSLLYKMQLEGVSDNMVIALIRSGSLETGKFSGASARVQDDKSNNGGIEDGTDNTIILKVDEKVIKSLLGKG